MNEWSMKNGQRIMVNEEMGNEWSMNGPRRMGNEWPERSEGFKYEIFAREAILKGGGLLPGWVKLPVRVIGGASPPRTPPLSLY
jgi:hypothetical protein